jgi:hypothetical protein
MSEIVIAVIKNHDMQPRHFIISYKYYYITQAVMERSRKIAEISTAERILKCNILQQLS